MDRIVVLRNWGYSVSKDKVGGLMNKELDSMWKEAAIG